MKSAELRKETAIRMVMPGDISFDEAVEQYIRAGRSNGRKPKTLEVYHYQLKHIIEWMRENYGEDIRPCDVDMVIIDNYKIAHLNNSGIKRSTANLSLRLLKQLYKFLEERELIDHNPIARAEAMRCDKVKLQPYSHDDIAKLLKSCEGKRDYSEWRMYVAYLVLFDSGLRCNEICGLQMRDIRWDNQGAILTVRAEQSKNHKERQTWIAHTAARELDLFINRWRRGAQPGLMDTYNNV